MSICADDVQALKEPFSINWKDEGLSKVICVNDEQKLNTQLPIEVTDEGIAICSNEEQQLNALLPIKVTEDGITTCSFSNCISICVNDEQLEKEQDSIFFTEEGIIMSFNKLHPSNALCPIIVKDEGDSNIIFFNDVHSSKTWSSIIVIDDGIVICVNDWFRLNNLLGILLILPEITSELTPLNIKLPKDVTDEGIDICCNARHPLKASPLIVVTEEGIDIAVNALHWSNAFASIEFTEDGSSNVTWVNEEHAQNAPHPMTCTEEGIIICFNEIQYEKVL